MELGGKLLNSKETQTQEDEGSNSSSFCLSQMKNQFQNAMEIIKSDEMSHLDQEIQMLNRYDVQTSWDQT